MRILFVLLLLSTYGLAQAQVPELAYSQAEFDSFGCCWRKLNTEKKYAESAALLENYTKNSPNAVSKMPLYWHAGQMFATAGNNHKAIKYMKKTYNIFYRWFGGEEGKQWYFYAKGTIAFIKQDRKKMKRMIYLWHKNKLPEDVNLIEMKKLLDNWGKTYNEAY